jgi:hypothetical protein
MAEEQARTRRHDLTEETRALQERRDRALLELRKLSSYLEDALSDAPSDPDPLPDALNLEARRFGRRKGPTSTDSA